ncbi:S8 family serine peptidase [Streptomyces sp. LMG1-1-1.1]|uniref:S8 family serine peptidase n=1 Tax=Streptomyces sp. LMG1-1-1.1 TaxID=3135245 RepID=UPI0034669D48
MKRLSRSASAVWGVLAVVGLAGAAVPSAAGAKDRAGERSAYVVVLKDGTGDPAAVSSRLTRRYGAVATAVFRHALRGYGARLTAAEAAELRGDPAVRFVSRQRSYRIVPPTRRVAVAGAHGAAPQVRPAAAGAVACGEWVGAGQCLPEWADRVEADGSSARSGDGHGSVAGVNVAVIDSGIDAGHADLNVRGGADCLSGSPVVPGASLVVGDPHGTEAAGVVAAKDDGAGIVGMAPGAPLWAVKVFPDDASGVGSDEALLCGLDWVVSTRTDGDPGNDIHVVNMSLSSEEDGRADTDDGACGASDGDAFHMAICAAVRAGVTPVAAAGNDNVDLARRAPASYQEVLTATAMADFDGRPGAKAGPDCYGDDFGLFGAADDQAALEFSNFARSKGDRRHTVSAPGICVLTTSSDPAAPYAAVDGTSFASPVVAGVAVLCIAYGPCSKSAAADNVRSLADDARRHQRAHPGYGFDGDDDSPVPGRHYGPLVHAARY